MSSGKVIKKGLAKLGLITAPDATFKSGNVDGKGKTLRNSAINFVVYARLGHWLGMNVHDVGDYKTPLKAGMIFTNEPGIYIREDALDYLPDTPANREVSRKSAPAF
jgi:Xaa-Pro aminopeptidase